VSIRVLIVEDEADISSLIKRALERQSHAYVEVAERGDTGVEMATLNPPSLVVLDINLPGLNGFEVCRILRSRPATVRVPIIVLTARTAESDAVSALELGADDYITKPFRMRELVARVKAVLRRTEPGQATNGQLCAMYSGARLTVDFDGVSVSAEGRPVRVTRREFELLRALVENRNRVLSRDRLLERVWGPETPTGTRSVDVHIARLRAKLGPAGEQIETVMGLGYRFVEEPSSPLDSTGAAEP
jgi:DNA-binding response OmpR family regulator